MLSRFLPLAFALGAVAQPNSSRATTSAPASSIASVNTESAVVWLGTGVSPGFAVSVVCADKDATTYAVTTEDVTLTFTQGPSIYEAAFSSKTKGAAASFSESCKLEGTTSASCTGSVSVHGNGVHTSTAVGTVMTGNEVATNFRTVSVTAGGSKLATPTGKCSTGNAAAPTGFAVSDVYKVVVVPAAAVMAGVLL